MKKMFPMIVVCALTLAMVTGLTGCDSSNNEATAEKAAVCYVLGKYR